MSGSSTTREDVERQATDLCDPCATMVSRIHAAATLRALLAERDALTAERDWTADQASNAIDAMNAAEAERDAARAECTATSAAWLRVIQTENHCKATGEPCRATRCGCAEERALLIAEHVAALNGGTDA